MKNNNTKDYSEQLEFWTVNLIMRAIVNQSSDFPVRRTGSYRHKKALGYTILIQIRALEG